MLFCDIMKNFESTLKRFADPYSVARNLSDELSTTPVRLISSASAPPPPLPPNVHYLSAPESHQKLSPTVKDLMAAVASFCTSGSACTRDCHQARWLEVGLRLMSSRRSVWRFQVWVLPGILFLFFLFSLLFRTFWVFLGYRTCSAPSGWSENGSSLSISFPSLFLISSIIIIMDNNWRIGRD